MNDQTPDQPLSGYQTHPIPRVLRPWVEAVWTLRPAPQARWTEHVWPQLGADLVVAVGSRYRRSAVGHRSEWVDRAVIDGVGLAARRYVHTGADVLAGMRLRPGAVGALVGRGQAVELGGRAVALGDLGLDAHLDEELAGADDPGAQVRRLLAWLDRHLPDTPPWAGVEAAIDQLSQQCSVNEVAESLGVSTRTLQRRFRRQVGLSPKQAQRLLRFRLAVDILDNRFADEGFLCALEAGYADQAHFCRECAEITGQPPGNWWGVSHSFNRA